MFKNFCRICLEERPTFLEIFTDDGSPESVVKTIYLCFKIELRYDKTLPSVMCSLCKDDLDAANKFRLNYETFDEKYRGHFGDENTSQIVKQVGPFSSENSLDGLISIEIKKERCPHTAINSKLLLSKNICEDSECELCSKTLETNVSLQRHQFTLHETKTCSKESVKNTKLHKCSECSYTTTYSQTFVNHVRRHNGERPYKCECGKSFTQHSSLNAHRKSLHSSIKQFTCPECGKQFKLSYALKKHLNVHKSGTFACEICKKILKSKTTLNDHMLRHENIHNFSCEDCGSTFVTSSELINHKKKHKTSQKFECTLCGLKTHSKKNLAVHVKRHTGDRSYKCQQCEKAFFKLSELREHQRSHTREKPYQCPVCTQKFKHTSSRRSHMKIVHNINNLPSQK